MKNVEKFNEYIQLVKDEYNAVGIAVSIFDLEKDLFKSFIGTRDGEKPIDGDTIFGVASITKSFTALAILKLYEEGIIDIYDNIDNYIEGLNIRKEQMPKIYHLLSHTGGFLPQKKIIDKKCN
jgi:CubicO group peptidase (beta-lactamase class C family)